MTTIRRLRLGDDLRDLIALSQEFFEEYAAHHEFFQVDELKDEEVLGFFSRSLNTEEGATFVAELAGRMVAYITVFVRPQPTFWRVKQVGAISGLMVHREHRRQGIAGRLLGEAVAFFQQKGVRFYTAYTAAANQPAIAFYGANSMVPLTLTMMGETASSHEQAQPGLAEIA
jgi:ribosomal protein S18 acetylase RimI-like enzyme